MEGISVLLMVVSLLLRAVPTAHAQSGDGYDLRHHVVSGGGTMDQPAVGTIAGSGYGLRAGSWPAVAAAIFSTGEVVCIGFSGALPWCGAGGG